MNSEILVQTGENYRNLRDTLEDQKNQMKKVFHKLSTNLYQMSVGFMELFVLASWTFLMIWLMFQN